jgi:hypothetical protein
MRTVITATAVATAGLVAAGVLGVASAETPTAPATPAPRSVSVEGVATEPIDQSATAAVATTVYRQGMTDAVSDGQAKALFLAGKTGASLGAVQSIAEGGGYIACVGNNEYLGEQPDFGSSAVSIPASGVSKRGAPARPVPAVHGPVVRHRRHRRAPVAKHASAATCTLSTQVSLVYALS